MSRKQVRQAPTPVMPTPPPQILDPVEAAAPELAGLAVALTAAMETPILVNDEIGAKVARLALLKAIAGVVNESGIAKEYDRLREELREVYKETGQAMACPGWVLSYDPKDISGYTVAPRRDWHIRLNRLVTAPPPLAPVK